MLDRDQPADARGQGDDVVPLLRAELDERVELFPAVRGRLFDEREKTQPTRRGRVLLLAVKSDPGARVHPVLIEAGATFPVDGLTIRPDSFGPSVREQAGLGGCGIHAIKMGTRQDDRTGFRY
ncbi:hypothetical protein ACWFQ8_19375 [Streptomyces sp. NPDC055254]